MFVCCVTVIVYCAPGTSFHPTQSVWLPAMEPVAGVPGEKTLGVQVTPAVAEPLDEPVDEGLDGLAESDLPQAAQSRNTGSHNQRRMSQSRGEECERFFRKSQGFSQLGGLPPSTRFARSHSERWNV